jgi:ankyrin repeat protein
MKRLMRPAVTSTLLVSIGLLLLAAITPVSSAKAPPLEPPDGSRGIIGVKVKVFPPAQTGWGSADVVYFARVVDDSDRFGAEGVISSNYVKGGHIYLLNAKPGRYVAVGCKFVLGTAGDIGQVVFSRADILRSEVEVGAGGVVFMGAIVAESSTNTRELDQAQAHYLSIIAPAAARKGFVARVFSREFAYTAVFTSVVRDPSAAKAFWNKAIAKHFKNEPAWANGLAVRSLTPGGVTAGSTGTASSSDRFLSAVCVDVNTAKARASGQPQEAAKIARLICESILTDWVSSGCGEKPDQAPCRKRLASFDGSMTSAGSSLLFAAAEAGETAICSVMIAMGSDPNAAISTGWTPLMIAAAGNRPETVRLLLDRGASRDAKNPDGKTPAMIAAEAGHPAIVELLTKASAP